MFTEINCPPALTNPVGLQPCRLRGLKDLVVLAGPNGAGKSRYLQVLEKLVNIAQVYWRTIERYGFLDRDENPDHAIGGLDVLRAPSVVELEHAINRLLELERMDPEQFRHSFFTEQSSKDVLQELQPIRAMVKLALKGSSHGHTKVIRLEYQLQNIGREDPRQMAPYKISQLANGNISGGLESALGSIYAYAFNVAKAYFDVKHPDISSRNDVQQRVKDARMFNQMLEALLGAQMLQELDDNGAVLPLFRGRPFNPLELSAGEQVLMGWAIMLHRQKAWLAGSQVLIDEPENHLHPDACIRAIEALRYDILGPEGQIWIATHSVPLIAYAGIDSVHLVDNDSIKYAGNQIDLVLERLLGGSKGRDRLRALMADASDLAFEAFAAQSLLPPGVVSAQKDDPQQTQMVEALGALGLDRDVVRILDFGAGRGRLAVALKEAALAADRKFLYYAFIHSSTDSAECLEQIRALDQPQGPEQYLIRRLDQFLIPDTRKMDLVVMCNVLHEIPVEDWQQTFHEIDDVLAENGYLVILEDQLPSVGELPHPSGYIILDGMALRALFGSERSICSLPSAKDGRLTAFAVAKQFLNKVNPTTIGQSLGMVSRNAEKEIQQLRMEGRNQRSHQLGRQHAHFTMLYANAQLALKKYPTQA